MERDTTVEALFQDLMSNGSMDEPWTVRPTQVVKPVLSRLPFRVNEAINILRGNIQMSGYRLKAIAVTSARAHEGKSSIAFRLAKSMAALDKKVLYLDCDIRNSRIQERYQIEGEYKGLSEYLCGKSQLEEIVYHTDDKWLDIVFAGAVAPNPSELISGSLFGDLMSFGRHNYDYVILDTPPVNLVVDGLLVAKQCDGTILVVESGSTERAQAEKAKQQLQYAGIKILGAVLNKAGAEGGRYGYGYGYGNYGYGYGYGKHYGAEKEEGQGEDTDGKKKRKRKHRR